MQKKDPVFQEMLALAQELADLEEQILNTVSEEFPVGNRTASCRIE